MSDQMSLPRRFGANSEYLRLTPNTSESYDIKNSNIMYSFLFEYMIYIHYYLYIQHIFENTTFHILLPGVTFGHSYGHS